MLKTKLPVLRDPGAGLMGYLNQEKNVPYLCNPNHSEPETVQDKCRSKEAKRGPEES